MDYKVVINHDNRINNRVYTYASDLDIKIGCRVIVPFGKGNKKIMALVIAREKSKLNRVKIKNIFQVLDREPLINQEMLALAFYMQNNCLSDLSSCISTVLPPGNWQKIKEFFYIEQSDGSKLANYLSTYRSMEQILENFPQFNQEHIYALCEKGRLKKVFGLNKNLPKTKKIKSFQHNPEFLGDSIPERAFKQKELLDFLKTGPKTQKQITDKGFAYSVLKELVKKQAVVYREEKVFREIIENEKPYERVSLNSKQKEIINTIKEKTGFFYLHGVTGSGKTEIYLQLVEEVLNKGREALILVPEISLTPQTIERFSGRFGNNIAIFHSKLSVLEKFEQYELIRTGKVKIAIGVRSAIFLPFRNLGLIVIDEAHEGSYQSDNNPKYDAIDIAEKRAIFHKANLILGSATPSVTQYFSSLYGKYTLLELTKRANRKPLPSVHIVDMKQEMKKGNMSLISELLINKIQKCMDRGEQCLLFLNKRGHQSFFYCKRCGYVHKCDSCDVAMTYHKTCHRMICHVCGKTSLPLQECPSCGSKRITAFGGGTQLLEEEIRQYFPDKRIQRIDKDSVSQRKVYEDVFKRMTNREIDILIGTQMISKGHDFPNVTLVGMILADLSLNVGHYSSRERTFQLITQVSGRAGRGTKNGEVVVQTFRPYDSVIKDAVQNDFMSFYNSEIEIRKNFLYPPFATIIRINISHDSADEVEKLSYLLATVLDRELKKYKVGVYATTPHPSPIAKIKNKYRYDLIYKIKDQEETVKNCFRNVLLLNLYNIDFKGSSISLSINPNNLF